VLAVLAGCSSNKGPSTQDDGVFTYLLDRKSTWAEEKIDTMPPLPQASNLIAFTVSQNTPLTFSVDKTTLTVEGQVFNEGDFLSIDGTSGLVYGGQIKTAPSEIIAGLIHKDKAAQATEKFKSYAQLMKWCNQATRLQVRTNADDGQRDLLRHGAQEGGKVFLVGRLEQHLGQATGAEPGDLVHLGIRRETAAQAGKPVAKSVDQGLAVHHEAASSFGRA